MTTTYPTASNRRSQRGLTMISWIIVIAFLGFQAVLMMNVIPVYINDKSVKSVMASVESDPEFRTAGTKKIKDKIIKRLKINNIYDIHPDNITIKKTKRGVTVTVVYEPRGTLVGNLEYIVKFTHEATIIK